MNINYENNALNTKIEGTCLYRAKLSDDEIFQIIEKERIDDLGCRPIPQKTQRGTKIQESFSVLDEQIKELETDAIVIITEEAKKKDSWKEKSKLLKTIEQKAHSIKDSAEYQNLLKKQDLEESRISRLGESYIDEEWYDQVSTFLDSLPKWPNARFSHDLTDIINQDAFRKNKKELDTLKKEVDEIRKKRKKALLGPGFNSVAEMMDDDLGRKRRYLELKYPKSTEETLITDYDYWDREEERQKFKETYGIDYYSYRDKDLEEKIKRMEELEADTLPISEEAFQKKVKAPVYISFSSENPPVLMLCPNGKELQIKEIGNSGIRTKNDLIQKMEETEKARNKEEIPGFFIYRDIFGYKHLYDDITRIIKSERSKR